MNQQAERVQPKQTFQFSFTAGFTRDGKGSPIDLSLDPLLAQAKVGQTVQIELQAREVVWYGHRSNPAEDLRPQWTFVHENGTLQPSTLEAAVVWFGAKSRQPFRNDPA